MQHINSFDSNKNAVKINKKTNPLNWFKKRFNFLNEIHTYNLWNMKSILLLVCSIILFQVLVSLVIYPILSVLIFNYNALITVFILSHIMLIPLYVKFGFSFIGLAYNR